ncbi:chorismate mutase [Limibacillus halophilus]|uniref:chorismate mutase n=1 Tax=Limibacillus halophilus TaxID=1579333 RepID=A0A839SX29_9PROT|nr:chorismate mutase [Limibacillus halophilus]MBB3066086.1 chorismate mutase [Limibacillus halophilus]
MADEKDNLDDLRQQVDDVDARLQKLLMERASIVERIAGHKGKGPVTRPGREAQVLRRIVERHSGSFPLRGMLRIWREIISSSSLIQGHFDVAYFCGDVGPILRSITRDHYGTLAGLIPCGSAAQVLQHVSESPHVIGVLPFPQLEEQDSWWQALARSGSDVPKIIARLPFGSMASGEDKVEALAISRVKPEASGEDTSFLVVETHEQISRSGLRDLLQKAGLEVLSLRSYLESGGSTLSLLEVEGFVTEADKAFDALNALEDSRIGQCWFLGAAAVPLTANAIEKKPAGKGKQK